MARGCGVDAGETIKEKNITAKDDFTHACLETQPWSIIRVKVGGKVTCIDGFTGYLFCHERTRKVFFLYLGYSGISTVLCAIHCAYIRDEQ